MITMKVRNVLNTKVTMMIGITEIGVTLQQILAQMLEIMPKIMVRNQVMVQAVLLVTMVSLHFRIVICGK